jgi:hypothetical protein
MKTITRSILLAFVLAMLVASMIPTSTSAFDPVGYCSTANVEATTNDYTVTATGWGQWAQIVDMTSGDVIIRTDFGLNTTVFTWENLTLTEGVQYQVQISRSETNGYGYSIDNCIFTAPEPQAISIARFEYVNRAFEWDAIQDGLGYQVIDVRGGKWTAWTPAQSPGNWGWYEYRVWPWARSVPPGVYILVGQDVNGQTGEVARLVIP